MFLPKLKQLIARGIYSLWKQTLQWQFKRTCHSFKVGTRLIFIDIDNTIADTWPTLTNRSLYHSEEERHNGLAIFRNMRNWILKLPNEPETVIFYLSARPFWLKKSTFNWLFSNGLPVAKSSLLLVQKPQDKLYFLRLATSLRFSVTFVDDLSYNHEKGEIRLYDEVIDLVQSMHIHYIGYPELKEIHKLKNDY
jgi:hypothetical protein